MQAGPESGRDLAQIIVSVIVLNYQGKLVLPRCIDCLLRQTHDNYEIIIVDNASTDNSKDSLSRFLSHPSIRWVQSDRNLGVAGGRNLGVSLASGEVVAFIDNDGYAGPEWLEKGLVSLFRDKSIGAVGSLVFFSSKPDTLNGAGGMLNLAGYAKDICFDEPYATAMLPENICYPMGCGMIIRRDILEQMGPLDEASLKWFDDVELGVRTWRLGYKVVLAREARVQHEFHGVERVTSQAAWRRALSFEQARVRHAIKYTPGRHFASLLLNELAGVRLPLNRTAIGSMLVGLLSWFWNILHLPSALRLRQRFTQGVIHAPEPVFDSFNNFAEEVCDIHAGSPEESLSGRVLKNSLWLGLRQIAAQLLGTLTGIFLARSLSPGEFGIYAVSIFFFYALHGIGDLGLGASLVREKSEPDMRLFHLAFTVRQITGLSQFVLVWFAAPWLAAAYGLDSRYALLFRLISLAELVSSFQLVPSVLLERKLSFNRLAIVESIQVAVQSAVVLGLVYFGFGIWSFPYALLSFALTGAVLSNIFQPWSPRWHFTLHEFRESLPFALPYQCIGVVQLLRDSVTPVLAGMYLGAGAAGYLNWAQMLATAPVVGLMILQRVYLASFARVQGDPRQLAQLAQDSIFACSSLAAPLAVIVLVFAKPVTLIVFGAKWLPALLLFYPMWCATLFIPVSVPLLSVLNVMGKSRLALVYSLSLTLALWGIAVPLIYLAGAVGGAVAFGLVQFGTFILIYLVTRHLSIRVFRNVAVPWLAAIIMGAAAAGWTSYLPVQTIFSLMLNGVLALLLYLVLWKLVHSQTQYAESKIGE